MRFLLCLLTLAGLLVPVLSAAQLTEGQAEGGGWWGGTAWIAITAAFIIGAIVFVMQALKRPTRR